MSDHLLVVERGRFASVSDVRRYAQVLEKARDDHSMQRMVVDARGDASRTDAKAREAYWQWLEGRPFERVAFVCEDEMLVTELNMLALGRDIKARAFSDLGAAAAWVRKPSSSGDRYVRAEDSGKPAVAE